LLLLVHTCSSSPQLIGSRGVITLREGFEYRDPETVEASESIARFAKEFQELDDEIAEQHSRSNSFNSRLNEVTPRFHTQVLDNVKGRPLVENEIFDFLESRFLEPPQELQFNKFLDEVEIERATSPTRLLPGEGQPPTPRPATRAPNRLVNLQRPVEESVRSQNAQLSTVFGPPSNNNFNTERRPGPAQNNFLDSNQLVNNLPNNGFSAIPQNRPAAVFPSNLPPDANGPHVIRPFVNLNAEPMFVSGTEPVPLQIPQPHTGVDPSGFNGGIINTQLQDNFIPSSPPLLQGLGFGFHGGVHLQESVVPSSSLYGGILNTQVQESVGPSRHPIIQGLGSTFHHDAGFSGGSFHQAIGLSNGHLSEISPSHHYSGDTGFYDLSSSPYQGLAGLPLSTPAHVSNIGLSSLADPSYQQYLGPQLSHNVNLPINSVPQIFGSGAERYPSPHGLASGSLHSGLQGAPPGQLARFTGLRGPSHSFSEGPHHSLSIQHLH